MGENIGVLKDMAAQLAAKLRVQGEGGRDAWSTLQGKLAEVAAASTGDDPRTAVQALLKVAREASSSQALMRTLQERVDQDWLKYFVYLVADELKMTPLGDSEPVQMVDENGKFCEGNVDRIIKSSRELSRPDACYHVVSIVGAQSSGKSYLLNRLFGTRFPEMNAQNGRSRTSKGIMISRCIAPSLLLLDVEGFDGREKGQDKLYENQAALYALAVSDLMMVNIAIHDIGREQGGSRQLFRTIFKERTKLNSAGITKILVVVRFYDGETPIETLRKDVLKTLETSWESVNEEHVKFKDYIEVHILGMPDKKDPEFPKEVAKLRKLLSDNRGSKFAASSFSISSKILWKDIKKNKELDIKSHQVALATLFCQKLVDDTLKSLVYSEKYKKLQDEESPQGFIDISNGLLREVRAEYDLKTKKHDPAVSAEERQSLVEKLYKILTGDSKELMRRVKEETLEEFKSVFNSNAQKMKQADIDIYGKKIVDESLQKFMSSFEDMKVFDFDYLKKISGDLKRKMQSYTASRTAEIKEERAKKEREKYKNIATQAAFLGVHIATQGAINLNN